MGVFCLLTTQLSAQRDLYWSDIAQGNIKVTNLDGDGTQDTLLQQSIVDYHTANLDRSLLFWVDRGRGEIVRAFVDGTDATVIASGLTDPKGIAYNDGILYFIEGSTIQTMNEDGDRFGTILDDITAPADLTVVDDMIYFSDTEENTIERVESPQGLNRTVILSNVANPVDIDIDVTNGKIYYAQKLSGGSQRGVWRANLDGTEQEQIVSGSVNGIAVEENAGFLYWSESIFNTINRIDLVTMEQIRLINSSLPIPKSINIDRSGNKVYFTDNRYGDVLLSANLETGGELTVLASSEVYRPTQVIVHAAAEKIYWVNAKTSFVNDTRVDIMRADLDGNNLETLISRPDLNRVEGLTLDTINGHLYFTEQSLGRVVRVNIDGTDRTELVTGLSNPAGITLDLPNNHLYWTDWGSDKIQRADLDGSNVTDIITTGLSIPLEIKIYAGIGKIYWTDRGDGSISRANLDGSEVEIFAPLDATTQVGGSSLFIDEVNAKVYFLSATSRSNHNLQRADPDGTNAEDVVSSNLGSPGSLFFVNNGPPSSVLNVIEGAAVRVVPNPASDMVTLSSSETITAVRLYASDGRLQYVRAGLSTLSHRINATNFPSGLYYGVVFYQNGRAAGLSLVRE